MGVDLGPIWLSMQLALVTTLLLAIVGIPIAYGLSVWNSKMKPLVEALISLPLVLPPTVIGFYLLLAFSPSNSFGAFLSSAGIQLAFSFEGLVIASILYSLPFMVNPIYSGFSALPSSLQEASYVLGHSTLKTLWKVLLPNIKPSLLNALVLSFAHTIGEFGVVLMIGGNIPNKTRVASIAIYNQVEAMNYQNANTYSLILLGITFTILVVVFVVNRKYSNASAL